MLNKFKKIKENSKGRGFYITVEELKYYFPLSYRRYLISKDYSNNVYNIIKNNILGVSIGDYLRIWRDPGTNKAEFICKYCYEDLDKNTIQFVINELKEQGGIK